MEEAVGDIDVNEDIDGVGSDETDGEAVEEKDGDKVAVTE